MLGSPPACSGSPVIQVKKPAMSSPVVAPKTGRCFRQPRQDMAFNPAPGASGIIPYYGLRLTGVQGWQTYDMSRFLSETLFLSSSTRIPAASDSYLNGHRRQCPMAATLPACGQPILLNQPEAARRPEHLPAIRQRSRPEQRLDAARELLFDLEALPTAMSARSRK